MTVVRWDPFRDFGFTAPSTTWMPPVDIYQTGDHELVLNAGKYAYPEGAQGAIWVRLVQEDKTTVLISVSDEGVGLPSDFNPATSKRLGTRLVNAMAEQLGAELTRLKPTHGTHYTLLVPLQAAPSN